MGWRSTNMQTFDRNSTEGPVEKSYDIRLALAPGAQRQTDLLQVNIIVLVRLTRYLLPGMVERGQTKNHRQFGGDFL